MLTQSKGLGGDELSETTTWALIELAPERQTERRGTRNVVAIALLLVLKGLEGEERTGEEELGRGL